MTPMQRTYAIAREATDAQQDVIKEMREKIEELCVERVELREAMRHMVRLDDPVVTGLVEALSRLVVIYESEYDEPPLRPAWIRWPLSAYEARVNEVWK